MLLFRFWESSRFLNFKVKKRRICDAHSEYIREEEVAYIYRETTCLSSFQNILKATRVNKSYLHANVSFLFVKKKLNENANDEKFSSITSQEEEKAKKKKKSGNIY